MVRGTTNPDTFKAALYLASATVNSSTTAYSATGEVSGAGYTAGGVTVSFATAPATASTTAYVTPSASITFTGIKLSSSFDALLLYNNTAPGKNAVSVHTFTPQTIVAGTLTLTMPVNDSATALLRIN